MENQAVKSAGNDELVKGILALVETRIDQRTLQFRIQSDVQLLDLLGRTNRSLGQIGRFAKHSLRQARIAIGA